MAIYIVASLKELESKEALFSAWLSEEERTYIGSFRFKDDRRGRRAVRGIARLLLATETGADPDTFVLKKHENGKIICDGLPFYLSFTHTKRFAAVALSAAPCGIDIEERQRKVNAEGIAKRFFPEAEVQRFNAQPDLFFKMWTAKEAFYKFREGNLRRPLKEITTAADFSSVHFGDAIYPLTSIETRVDGVELIIAIVGAGPWRTL